MKMVSAAKLKGDETRLAIAKPFNAWTDKICGQPTLIESPAHVDYKELPQRTLIAPLTSDKGLCGGINSFITRAVKDCVLKIDAQGKECDIVIVGDKGRSQLNRAIPESINAPLPKWNLLGTSILRLRFLPSLLLPVQPIMMLL